MKTVTTRCGACIAPFGPGTDPGLTVVKRNAPLGSVMMRPKPRNGAAVAAFDDDEAVADARRHGEGARRGTGARRSRPHAQRRDRVGGRVRGLSGPGRGHGQTVSSAMRQVLIGDAVGRITGRAGLADFRERLDGGHGFGDLGAAEPFEAGAAEVHVRVSSPPVVSQCYYGIDFADPNELIAANKTVEEVREFIGATTLAYLSLEGLQASTRRPSSTASAASGWPRPSG